MTKEELEALIGRYLSGEASEAEERMIDDFFAAQERNESEKDYSVSEPMWAQIERGIHQPAFIENAPERKEKTLRSNRRIWMTSLTGLALFMAIVYVIFQRPFTSAASDTPWITLDTPYGQKSLVTLPDGTRIFLNGGSTISYPEVFAPEKREVNLSGEAFFEVAPNPQQPFIVTASGVITEVLGTSFNVQAFPDKQVSVTVATGSVRVAIRPASAQAEAVSSSRVILAPNDQAIYNPAQGGFTVTEVNLDKYLAWKDNTLLFEDMSIEEVARILERWYNVTIVFDDDTIKTCLVNGKYKNQSLESVLQSIQYMYHVDFKFTLPNKVRLDGKGCNYQPANSS